MKSWSERRLDRIKKKQLMARRQAELQDVLARYPRKTGWAAFVDWLAVFVAFQSFIFLVAWQAYPEWDDTQIVPTFIRAVLVSMPITLGMWGVARALRAGSAVPQDMARKIPYGKVGADGTVGGTTFDDEEQGNPPTLINPQGEKEEGQDENTK